MYRGLTGKVLMYERKYFQQGFTLVEMMVVAAILGILLVIAVPIYMNSSETVKVAADQSNLRILNSATMQYRISENINSDEDVFAGISDNHERMQILVNNNYIDDVPEFQSIGGSFIWEITRQVWLIEINGVVISGDAYKLLDTDVTIQPSGYYVGRIGRNLVGETVPYSGGELNIEIPKFIGDTLVSGVWQDVFKDKGLLSLRFDEESGITQIHARAFMNNNLNSLVLPPNITRIDWWAFRNNDLSEVILPPSVEHIESEAFRDNNINKVTIGDNVSLENNIFRGNNEFKEAYESGGAGTYVYDDESYLWVKEY
jgi:prepilin-type N-terminal cleavage/methylation domain-containing protein